MDTEESKLLPQRKRIDCTPALSERQAEVLRSLNDGCTVIDIALELHVTEKTVYEHVQRAKEKTGLNSMFQLGAWFVRYEFQRYLFLTEPNVYP